MNLKCMINGKISGVYLPNYNGDNNLIQGNTITDEYSETLDSGSIILTNISKIKNLDPYDDVYIWDADFLPNFNGITKTVDSNGCVINHFEIFTDSSNNKKFYKHFLLDRFTEERNLLNQNNYTYKIELFSETKGLETVVLPNIIITQPLDVEKRLSTFTYMKQFLEMYSPKIKIKNGSSWNYQQKYNLSPEMYDLFKNHYCQQFSLNSPTLRELFTKLMVSKDCIPVVKDNVIYPLMLSKTIGEFNISNDEKSFITSNKSSDGYATQFRTNYNSGLTGEARCHRVEKLGFRNSDEAILTINNMRLETSFPIYKLNKVYVCYYKRINPLYNSGTTIGGNYYFLCKQDITDFCVLNNERQALYKDTRIASADNPTIDEMKQCYYFTLGYSIGSNLITGFGEMFSHLTFSQGSFTYWNKQECIFRNLMNAIDKIYPYGLERKDELLVKLNQALQAHGDNQTDNIYVDNSVTFEGFSINETTNKYPTNTSAKTVPTIFLDATFGGFEKDSLVAKTFNFEIDYEGFYNGAIYTSKESYKKPIVKVDNQSDSMPILDLDGIAKERKIEKMGNKTYTINARYENWEDVQNVGTIFRIGGNEENQDDYEEIIIYHRDISLYDNCINVTYFGQESFVLKNFYTSVFSKQRLYNVLDYGNSIKRTENIKDIVLFSKNKQYDITPHLKNTYFNLKNYFSTLCNDTTYLEHPLDTIILDFYDINNNQIVKSAKYFADINSFVSGNSMCFNTTMFDNLTMGTSIDKEHLSGKYWLHGKAWQEKNDDPTNSNANHAGTTQFLCSVHNDRKTGRSEYIRFIFSSSVSIVDQIYHDTTDVASWQVEKFLLPMCSNINTQIGTLLGQYDEKVYKDANETIDTTFQIQVMVDKKDKNDVFLGNNLLKYNHLIKPIERKNSIEYLPSINTIYLVPFQIVKSHNLAMNPTKYKGSLQGFIVRIPKNIEWKVANNTFSVNFKLNIDTNKSDALNLNGDEIGGNKDRINSWYINLDGNPNMKFIPQNPTSGNVVSVKLTFSQVISYLYSDSSGSSSYMNNSINNDCYLYLDEIDSSYIEEAPGVDKQNFNYYTNIYMSPIGQEIKKMPILNNYYTSNQTSAGSQNRINIAPTDSNRYNNTFWGRTIENNNFAPSGIPYYSYISNYFDTNDTCLVDGVSKNMLSYSILDSNYNSGYGMEKITVFKDLNIDTQAYFSWKIVDTTNEVQNQTELLDIPNNTLVCVAAPRIETSLVDEKTTDFSDFAGYSVLMDGNNVRAYTDIFSILDVSNANDTTGRLHIDLTHVPSNKDSIQEWIYNAKTNEYYFVCGFNISSEDRENGYIDIYLSLVGDLDLEVYDDKGILKGYVGNKAKNENDVVDLT